MYHNYNVAAHPLSRVFIPQLKLIAIETSLVHYLALSGPRSMQAFGRRRVGAFAGRPIYTSTVVRFRNSPLACIMPKSMHIVWVRWCANLGAPCPYHSVGESLYASREFSEVSRRDSPPVILATQIRFTATWDTGSETCAHGATAQWDPAVPIPRAIHDVPSSPHTANHAFETTTLGNIQQVSSGSVSIQRSAPDLSQGDVSA